MKSKQIATPPRHFLTALFLILLVCFSCSSYAQTSKLEANIDKNPVMLDESFTLTVTMSGDVDRDAFDASTLLSNFVVGRTSVSSQTRMVNFKTSRSTTWSTILFPRAIGEFTIPAFQIDDQVSQPIVVSVIPVSAGSNTQSRDVFVKTELEKDTVYLHQQVKYSIKLYLAREIERGSLQAPELDYAEIQQIGKDAEYSEILNGKRYRVINRDFAIIPQRSGEFTINGPIFQGDIIANSRQSFGFFNRTQSVNRVGPTQKIKVLAIPDTVTGPFLPSEFVELHQEWSADPQVWRVGEPITRTITLTAVGLTESLLPEIDDIYPPDIKTYPDQANTTSAENEQSIIAQRTESIALIPARAGQFVIPPVSVEWFNVVTETVETATLPGLSVSVLPASNESTADNIPNDNTSLTATSPIRADDTDGNATESTEILTQKIAANLVRITELEILVSRWRLASVCLFGLLIVISLVFLFWRTKSPKDKSVTLITQSDSEQQAWKGLLDAISNDNPVTVRARLLLWLQRAANTQSTDLAEILQNLEHGSILEQINLLFAARYADSRQSWQSDVLHGQLKDLRTRLHSNTEVSALLKPLYPA